MNTTNKIFSEISAGELMDKITILEIKKIKITDANKQIIINKELDSLNATCQASIATTTELTEQIAKLKAINLKLWDIEEGKRECERQKDFSETFIGLARSVYIENDNRAKIKAEINRLTNSTISEVKSYKAY
jgi:cytolysin (calcineurin-like family phosphatase)